MEKGRSILVKSQYKDQVWYDPPWYKTMGLTHGDRKRDIIPESPADTRVVTAG